MMLLMDKLFLGPLGDERRALPPFREHPRTFYISLFSYFFLFVFLSDLALNCKLAPVLYVSARMKAM